MYRNIFYSFDSQIKVYVTGMCVTECVVNIYKINVSIYVQPNIILGGQSFEICFMYLGQIFVQSISH